MTERDELPRHTTPTWEMELLISGATVFALLQLPGALDELFYSYFPRFERPLAEMVLLPYLYGKTTVYALIGTFILHLAARGYWVGLVGLRSVYPDGVRWDRFKWGPHFRAAVQKRTRAPDDMVERADNRASLVFGYGVGFALLTLMPLAVVVLVALMTGLVQFVTGAYFPWQRVWTTLLVLSVAPFVLGIWVDRLLGKRLRPGGIASRLLDGVLGNYLRFGMGSASSYPMLMFTSRAGQKRGGMLVTAALLLLVGLTAGQMMLREGDLDVGSYGALEMGEAGSASVVSGAYYANRRRGADVALAAPFIPSEVVRGDWLRLFVPYQPRRDNSAVALGCGDAPTPSPDPLLHAYDAERLADDAARAFVLDCLVRIYALELDGKPLQGVRFDAAEDEASGLRGVLAMIPAATLAPGRHELLVHRARSPLAEPDDPDPQPHRIAFWR